MAVEPTFDVGDLVRLVANFRNSAGALTDPTSPTFSYRPPGASAATVLIYPAASEIIKDATGVFRIELWVNEHGTWRWRWHGTGSATGAKEGSFKVRESLVL